ncbi:MAG: class F sortase [Acidimicrobiales bacterium]
MHEASRAVVPAPRSVPVHLTIPAIGVSTGLVQLGLLANGAPQVPASWHIAGWYKLGPSPGQVGSSVILGHVDSVGGPAVFYRLNQLKIGSKVIVKLADGQTVYFQVTALREYLKAKFPLQTVYGPRPYPALQLVTCGGAFDSATHHYLSSIVAFTKEIGS